MNLLDEITLGLAREAGLGPPPVVTIELPAVGVERLLGRLTELLKPTLTSHGRPMPSLMPGRVFVYRGVNFRIVEKALS